jgi:hypothetical protein
LWCGPSPTGSDCGNCPPGLECRPICHRTCGCDPFWPFCGCTTTCSVDSYCQPCADGRIVCGTKCTDLTSDAMNCGACGNSCASGLTCVNGSCIKQLTVSG